MNLVDSNTKKVIHMRMNKSEDLKGLNWKVHEKRLA